MGERPNDRFQAAHLIIGITEAVMKVLHALQRVTLGALWPARLAMSDVHFDT